MNDTVSTTAGAPPRRRLLPSRGFADQQGRGIELGEVIALYAACVTVALFASAVLVEATGGSWSEVFRALLDGSLMKPGRVGTTIGIAVPLLLVALGTIVSSQAGLVNIGQEGQVFIGAAVGAYVGVELGGPGPIALAVLLILGALGGAIWAGVAALLRYWRNVPEVLTTLLMVTIASQLVGFGLKHQSLLLAPAEGRANRQQVSEQLDDARRIPRVAWFGNEFPISAMLAIALAIGVSLVMARSVFGFRLRMLGANPRTARRAGTGEARFGTLGLVISGGFAGLAGAVMLAGGDFGNYTLVPGFSADIGWTGLLVALVARQRALAAIVTAMIFAGLRSGSGFLAATGVERRITNVVEGFLVLALLVPPALLFLRDRRRSLAAARARV